MKCEYQQYCGGCCFRDKTEEEYRRLKEDKVKGILAAALKQTDYVWEPPIFLPDGLRRRASMAFINDKNKLRLGFNENGNMQIVDCLKCPMLTPRLNALLPALRDFSQMSLRSQETEFHGALRCPKSIKKNTGKT